MQTATIWGDVATWVTGIATIALFVIGFIQIRNERVARVNSEKESEARNKRNQAEYISSWFVKETYHKNSHLIWLAISNQSVQPVYNVIVNVVVLSQDGEKLLGTKSYQTCVDIVPPGLGYVCVDVTDVGHPGHSRIGVEIGFKDRSGNNWVRKADGELLEIEQSTIQYFGIDLPTSWVGLYTELPEG